MANTRKYQSADNGKARRKSVDIGLEMACISIRNSKQVKRKKNLLDGKQNGKLTAYWQQQFNTMFKKW